MHYQIQEYIDELNEDYEFIRQSYAGSELLDEMIHCLNWLHPNWNTNRALGTGAAEFILSIIYMVEDSYHEDKQGVWLELMYACVGDAYPNAEAFYSSNFSDKCHWEIMQFTDEEFLGFYGVALASCSNEDFDKAHDKFYNMHVNEAPLDFKFD